MGKPVRKSSKNPRALAAWLMAAAIAVPALIALAQEFPTYQGSNARVGRHDGSLLTDNANRAFLRWWDPLVQLPLQIDNWEAGAVPIPVDGWDSPTGQVEAFNTVEADPLGGHPPYRYAPVTDSALNGDFWVPLTSGSGRAFEWRFNIAAGAQAALYVNIPIGPTDTDPGLGTSLVFPQQYYVYEIENVVNLADPGEPIRQVVDTFAAGGGTVRLGNDGGPTSRTFEADGTGPVIIRLLNTIPRDDQGLPTDGPNSPNPRSNVVVYADSASAVLGVGAQGTYVSSPIVGTLSGAVNTPRRVFSARNEPITVQSGNRVIDYDLGIMQSFRHDGWFYSAADNGTGRRNLAWSWPAVRPSSQTDAELTRYATEKRDFILGLPGGPSRSHVEIIADNAGANATSSAGWLLDTAVAGFYGINYFSAPVNTAAVTQTARFAPALPDGSYELYVWAGSGGSSFASRARIEVYLGAALFDVVNANLANGPGWVRISTANNVRYTNSSALPLSIRVTNFSPEATDAGKTVVADAAMFRKAADLAVTATPVFARANVRVGAVTAERDVVVVPMENGRLYCLDAAGNPGGTAVPDGSTDVLWTWPSETTGSDPNRVVGIDGPGGIAEMPTGFGLSSPLVQRVGTEDILYVAGENGRVFAIDMTGRGDGTTTRRWSYPDDYPATPTPGLGPIVGSVSFATTANGPTLFVPTVRGRVIALDAAGDNATKTTTVRWTYPAGAAPAIGSIRMAPVIEFGRVYFGTGAGSASLAGNNRFYALNADTGTLSWSRNTDAGQAFQPFNTAGPATAPAAVLNAVGGAMPDTVYMSNNGDVFALDAATGATVWATKAITPTGSQIDPQVDASGSLGLTYLRVFNNGGTLVPEPGVPVVMVPTRSGTYTALFAGTTVNRLGGKFAWGYRTEGPTPTSMAFGGRNLTAYAGEDARRDDEFGWMYGLDASGYMYGFNYDPDFPDNGQTITPGVQPGEQDLPPNDPTAENLTNIAENARVSLVLPAQFRELQSRLRSGALQYSEITDAVSASAVTRLNYDYGETLYYVIYDLPRSDDFTPNFQYSLDLQFTTPGNATQRRTLTVQSIPGTSPSGRGAVALVAFPLIGVGNNALSPGEAEVRVRVQAGVAQTAGPAQQQQTVSAASASVPDSRFAPGSEMNIANPLALKLTADAVIGTPAFGIGLTADPANAEVVNNGNFVGAGTTPRVLTQAFGRDADEALFYRANALVNHGQTGRSRFWLVDRSLMSLLLGDGRGLQNVRMEARDLNWNDQGTANTFSSVWKAFDLPALDGFEQAPGPIGLNTSPDYPDLTRDALTAAKQQFGQVENPLFEPIGLIPPVIDESDIQSYNTDASTYNAFLPRNLSDTVVDMELNVPKYQPPVRRVGGSGDFYGYFGLQSLYVDANNAGRQFTGTTAQEAYRDLRLGTNVAIDEAIVLGSTSVNLGPIPQGGGYSPLSPYVDPSFRLDSPLFHNGQFPFFQRFSALNDGNVNLLNVRVAKRWQTSGGTIPVPFMPNNQLHERSMLDAPLSLFTDIDPRFAPPQLGNRVVIQKPRVTDGVPTALRVNPIRRANPFIDATAGPLLDPIVWPVDDPKLGVAVPIGTPVGIYGQTLAVFEDADPAVSLSTDEGLNPLFNQLGGSTPVWESVAEPGLRVEFSVRESRLTNARTTKATSMVDQLGISPDDPFIWSNQNPSAVRDAFGNLVVAWSSNRRTSGSGLDEFGWNARPRTAGDTGNSDAWRLYFASLDGTQPGGGSLLATSPLRDLYQFTPAPDRWFLRNAEGYPRVNPAGLFGLNAGETMTQDQVSYRFPAFSTSGLFDPLTPMAGAGRSQFSPAFVAFVGEGLKTIVGQGTPVRTSRLFMTSATIAGDGQVAVAPNPIPLLNPNGSPVFPEARFGPPSLVQTGDTATVFFTLTSGGQSDIFWAYFESGAWQRVGGSNMVGRMQKRTAFESVASPSATLRRYQNGSQEARIDLVFTGKLRGRANAEVWLARLRAEGPGSQTPGLPVDDDGDAVLPFSPRLSRLAFDPATGLYWSSGADWLLNRQTLSAPANADTVFDGDAAYLDVVRRVPGGYTSVLRHATRRVDSESGILSYETVFGGRAYLDAGNGSVRFEGSLVPNGVELLVRFAPRYIRVSEGQGQNYRGSSSVYDERFIAEYSYWATSTGQAVAADAPARNDRLFVTYGSTGGQAGQNAQPFWRSLRFGIQLPTAVATGPDGAIPSGSLSVSGLVNGTFFQVDPINGRIYFSSENEGRLVTVTYRGIDEAGSLEPRPRTVQIVVDTLLESREQAVPMDQAVNESSVRLALDPQNNPFNGQPVGSRRPGVIWMFWTSTRAGTQDVYFQTVAPRFTPVTP